MKKVVVCRWCGIRKQITVPPLQLCPICDQGPLLMAQDAVKKKRRA